MTTKAVEEALEDKSPVMRGSNAHDRTFEIKAVREDEGLHAEITEIAIKKQFAPMHYDLYWSTKDSRDVPFRGHSFETREEALENAGKRQSKATNATAVPASKIAIVFETVNGDKYHFKNSIDFRLPTEGDLLYELLMNYDFSDDNTVQASYEPTSDTGGELTVRTSEGVLRLSRRAFEGEPSDEFSSDEEILDWHRSWISYRNEVSNGNEWAECPVINAYENDEGDELALAVETPVGEPTVFEFDVSADESAPYWDLVNNLASGDPANLADTDSSVHLRHRSRSFYEFGPYENSRVVENRLNDVICIDVNSEWELRVTSPNRIKDKVKNNTDSSVLSKISDFVSGLW